MLDVVLPRGHPLVIDDVGPLLRLAGATALLAALARARRRPARRARRAEAAALPAADRAAARLACFAGTGTYELVTRGDGRKLVGLAQRRRGGAALLQAAAYVAAPRLDVAAALGLPRDQEERLRARLARIATLDEVAPGFAAAPPPAAELRAVTTTDRAARRAAPYHLRMTLARRARRHAAHGATACVELVFATAAGRRARARRPALATATSQIALEAPDDEPALDRLRFLLGARRRHRAVPRHGRARRAAGRARVARPRPARRAHRHLPARARARVRGPARHVQEARRIERALVRRAGRAARGPRALADARRPRPALGGPGRRQRPRLAPRGGARRASPARSTSSGSRASRRTRPRRACCASASSAPGRSATFFLHGLGRYDRGLVGDLGLIRLCGDAARPSRRGGGHRRAARALRRVGGPREPAPAALRGRRAAGTRAASANRIRMNSVLVPPAGVLDGELREPLLRFVQAAFALAARDLANGERGAVRARRARGPRVVALQLPAALRRVPGRAPRAHPRAARRAPRAGAARGHAGRGRVRPPARRRRRRRPRGAARRRHVAAGRADRRARGRLRVPGRGLRRDLRPARPRRRRQPPPLRRDGAARRRARERAARRPRPRRLARARRRRATSRPAGPRRACSCRRASAASPTAAARWPSRSSSIPASARRASPTSSRTPCAPCASSPAPRIATGPVGFERIDGGPRPPVALSSVSSHHVEGAYYRFDTHLLVVARATAQRIGALDPRDPRREALGLFERALALDARAAGRRAARRAGHRAPLGALALAHGAARRRARGPRRRRAPARARPRRRRRRARRSPGRRRAPRAAGRRSSTSRTPTPWRPRPTRCCSARARARTWCRRASPTCRADATTPTQCGTSRVRPFMSRPQ